MGMGLSGIPGAPGAKGSSRLVDIQSFPSLIIGQAPNPGGGSDMGRLVPKGITQNSFSPDPFGGMSGMNIRDGRIFKYLAASSFNFGAGGGWVIPIVGRKPARPQQQAPEVQDYYGLEFLMGFGSGDDQGSNHGINPDPITGFAGIAVDVGLWLFPNDASLSSSAQGPFTNLSGQGTMSGCGIFMGADGQVHYGARKVRSGVATNLDVDIVLPVGVSAVGWPAADLLDFVRVRAEWFAPKNGQAGKFLLTLGNNPPLVNTTIADIGVAATGSGFDTQFPSCYGTDAGQSSETYGASWLIRGGPGTGSPVQTFPVAMAGMHLVGGPDLDTTHL